ncbi:ABC transporter ATP-binding protein [Methylomonas sp. UP202]|uniref:ABC transporter ATP-binding protein n=1 Tax=Methylomonas sp. UP202 TaxID=3040943 RepID=UPI00247A2E29|nr:ABC transporter ATP-binding protein [Methylomonas sp. UP202]WGS88444.1 ABC transporter ATP-binding protein [Methylomonas sp. UP202]
MSCAIKVEDLGKKYIIQHQQQSRYRYNSLGETLSHSFKNLGKTLLHPLQSNAGAERTEEFWALQDINFEIKHGDRVGIIGRNGAGKSTLLKILSRITNPSTGKITINGRVSSLLEVGTGFHPELTGRENIFLNGAILGMRKQEIQKKFDEIVDFAEVEKFLDTPVKHYSSGMYVRLAFSVAAHLEPDILIVDEVLSVGDSQFQKKCFEKMQEFNSKNITVIFVSHNMAIISELCTKGLLIKDGELKAVCSINECIDGYYKDYNEKTNFIQWSADSTPRNNKIVFNHAKIVNSDGNLAHAIKYKEEFSIILEYEVIVPIAGLRIGLMLQRNDGTLMCGSNDPDAWNNNVKKPGLYKTICKFPSHILNAGTYSVLLGADLPPHDKLLINTDYCMTFDIIDTDGHGARHEKLPGIIRPNLQWINLS